MDRSRRDFIRVNSLIGLGLIGLNHFSRGSVLSYIDLNMGFGPLVHKPGGILSLPKGFSAKIISRVGNVMTDQLLCPGNYYGMGAFKWDKDKILLVRNHKISPGVDDIGPFGKNNINLGKVDKHKFYDNSVGELICLGCTTTMIYNEQQQKLELEYLSLIGTIDNSSGGKTPWNSWIACETTELKKGDLGKGDEDGSLEKDHGFNFEVPATDKISLVDPVPLKAMGRFAHKAVAVHPGSGIVYQTEDRINGVFYRYLPATPNKLYGGGKLQALVIKEWKSADTRNWRCSKSDKFPQRKQFEVEWRDLDKVEAPENDLRDRAYKEEGAARFSTAGGIWYDNNELFFACTSGGVNFQGQIFRYIPSKYEGQPREKEFPGKIELFLETDNPSIFQNSDSLTIAPWGDVIICENKGDARIIGITATGEAYPIAQNIAYRGSELAGIAFSPSGNTLFVNIPFPGFTLAITGPWKS